MNINLANIDFAPGQGGGGQAVISELNVTENGTYRAPSGVDGYNPVNVSVSGGGSVTPEEQAALDTLVNSSEGALYTKTFEKYIQSNVVWPDIINADSSSMVFWGDLYVIYNAVLYKLNRESYQFDVVNNFDGMWAGASFFGDKSGRFYWNGRELDLENGTIGQVEISIPEFYRQGSLQNVFYGEYGVWFLGGNAYKFNESTQVFDTYPINNTFGYGGTSVYLNLFKYDGHILGVYDNKTFEVTEYEDHIDVADVTDVYFNMPSFGAVDSNYKSTKDGDLYNLKMYNVYMYDKSSGVWEDVKNIPYPIYNYSAIVSDNIAFSFFNENMYCMNLGQEFNNTYWTKISNVAVDLTSNQKISGYKTFNGQVGINNTLFVANVDSSDKNMMIASGPNDMTILGGRITFGDPYSNEVVIKNGTKQIATVDQTFVNSTFIPYGKNGDNLSYVSGDSSSSYNFNTYTNRMFKKVGSDWNEFDGTSTLIPVSFGVDFNGEWVYNSPTMTILIAWVTDRNNTYMWDDANTRWDFICASDTVGSSAIWFDGDNFRSGNEYKLVETGGVWSWVSDPLVNNIYDYNLKFGYKNGEVYAYNDTDWHMYKYDKVNCTLDRIGFVNAGSRLFSYFNELIYIMNGGETHIVDLSKVDPQNPDEWILGDDILFIASSDFIGATDRLWYYKNGELHSSYQNIYDTPEVPASNGTYVLKAVRSGDTVTYSWVLDV